MKYLLDTYTLLRIIADDPGLGENTRSIYLNEMNEISLSMASIWEMAIKISLGNCKFPAACRNLSKRISGVIK